MAATDTSPYSAGERRWVSTKVPTRPSARTLTPMAKFQAAPRAAASLMNKIMASAPGVPGPKDHEGSIRTQVARLFGPPLVRVHEHLDFVPTAPSCDPSWRPGVFFDARDGDVVSGGCGYCTWRGWLSVSMTR